MEQVDDGTSNRRKITLRYNDAVNLQGYRKFYFVRLHIGSGTGRRLAFPGRRIRRFFYKQLRHLLPIEAPGCYQAGYDGESLNSIVMLDDMTATVTEFCIRTTVMTRARAESQMRLLGTPHGYGYGNTALSEAAAPKTANEHRSICGARGH